MLNPAERLEKYQYQLRVALYYKHELTEALPHVDGHTFNYNVVNIAATESEIRCIRYIINTLKESNNAVC